MKNFIDKPWEELIDKEKCFRYEQSYLNEYRVDVDRLTKELTLAKEHLTIAEQQFSNGEVVISKFARVWKLP